MKSSEVEQSLQSLRISDSYVRRALRALGPACGIAVLSEIETMLTPAMCTPLIDGYSNISITTSLTVTTRLQHRSSMHILSILKM